MSVRGVAEATQQSRNLACNNHATLPATITQPCHTTITQPCNTTITQPCNTTITQPGLGGPFVRFTVGGKAEREQTHQSRHERHETREQTHEAKPRQCNNRASLHATEQSRNLARNRTITQPCNTTITQPSTQQSRNLASQQ
jgi:hypothetical protein